MDEHKKRKRSKRARKSSSSSSESSQSSENNEYRSDLNAFLHSIGVMGTSHRESSPPREGEARPEEEKDTPPRPKDKGRVRTPKVIETPTNKNTIPLPVSSAHMPKRGNPMSGPEPPSSAK